jgi:Rad3-related DNA helicase
MAIKNILSCVPPGWELKSWQIPVLEKIQACWHNTDVIAATLPTAWGKTIGMVTVANWVASQGKKANILEPDNLLVEQTLERYPEIKALHRQDRYTCTDLQSTCKQVKDASDWGEFCKNCVYTKAKREAKNAGVRVMNYHTYLANKMFADVNIFDEGHKLIDMLQESKIVKLWQSEHKFPDTFKELGDVISWIQSVQPEREDDILDTALSELLAVKDQATISYNKRLKGKYPDVQLQIMPGSTRQIPDYMWANGKIILFSATINAEDIRNLGLSNKRVTYIEGDSPIPYYNRPVLFSPKYHLTKKVERYAIPLIVKEIDRLLAIEPGKGLIHVPYALAASLKEVIDHPRLMWHDQNNKAEVLEQFKGMPADSGAVLVASGMYEGIDLPYEAATWQLIGKMPFLSLGNPHVEQRAQINPTWYAWETLKKVIQATGRICRAVDDKGRTYIADASFGRLLDEDKCRQVPLIPNYYKQAIRRVK